MANQAAAAGEKAPETSRKKARVRSPESPFVPLAKAIERAKEFWVEEKRGAAPVKVAAEHWGYKPKSSGALQTIAALKHFGLMSDEGAGDARKVKLTDLARRIVLDEQPDSEERAKAIRQAALTPKLYGQIWKKWGAELPSNGTFRTHLVLDRSFNESSADDVIKCYKDTLAYAKLTGPDSVPPEDADSDGTEEDQDVDAVRSDDSTTYVPSKGGKSQVRVFSWPLSKDVSAEVRVIGPSIRSDHLERLRQYLDLAKAALDADDTQS